MKPLSELDRTGFVIVRGFLDDETCDMFVEEFENQPGVKNPNYTARPVAKDGMERFNAIFMEKGLEIMKDSIYPCDMLAWGDYFSIKDGVETKWHADHEIYFFWQNHLHSYNFYIPIVKPDPAKTNLSVIPVDRIQQEMPELSTHLFGTGARMMIEVDGKQVIYDEENCRICAQVDSQALDKLSITPELAKGDLLMARGDVFHQTQDTSTRRVSISVRAVSSKLMIKKQTLVSGGASKLCYLTEMRGVYNMILDLFDLFGQDEFEAKVLSGVLQAMKKGITSRPTEEEFLMRVIAQRSPLDRKRLRLQARSLQTYEKREHFVRIASLIERIA